MKYSTGHLHSSRPRPGSSPWSDGSPYLRWQFRRRGWEGYALLMTLILLSVVAVAFASVARRVVRQSVAVRNAQTSLQERWALRSVAATLLPRVETTLRHEEELAEQPTPEVIRSFSLGNINLITLMLDEQARPNVNAVTAQSSSVPLVSVPGRRLRLQPVHPQHVAPNRERSYANFLTLGQVYSNTISLSGIPQAPESLLSNGSMDMSRLTIPGVTCWGDGRLNLQRADREALLQMTGDVLRTAEVDALLRWRQEQPGLGLATALDRLGIGEAQRRVLHKRLRDGTEAWGLWCLAVSPDRMCLEQHVLEQPAGHRDRTRIHTRTW